MSSYKGYTQSQNAATQRYHREHLEQIAIRVPKGTRARYNALAARRGESLTALICRLLDAEEMRDVPEQERKKGGI